MARSAVLSSCPIPGCQYETCRALSFLSFLKPDAPMSYETPELQLMSRQQIQVDPSCLLCQSGYPLAPPVPFPNMSWTQGLSGYPLEASPVNRHLTPTSIPSVADSNNSIERTPKKEHKKHNYTNTITEKAATNAKSKDCKHWKGGYCLYGEGCIFLHRPETLGRSQKTQTPITQQSWRYKTEVCTHWANKGFCKRRDLCNFKHELA